LLVATAAGIHCTVPLQLRSRRQLQLLLRSVKCHRDNGSSSCPSRCTQVLCNIFAQLSHSFIQSMVTDQACPPVRALMLAIPLH
jgi:hypothetical protein